MLITHAVIVYIVSVLICVMFIPPFYSDTNKKLKYALMMSIFIGLFVAHAICYIEHTYDYDDGLKTGYNKHDIVVYNQSLEYITYLKDNNIPYNEYDHACKTQCEGYIDGYDKYYKDIGIYKDDNVTKLQKEICGC